MNPRERGRAVKFSRHALVATGVFAVTAGTVIGSLASEPVTSAPPLSSTSVSRPVAPQLTPGDAAASNQEALERRAARTARDADRAALVDSAERNLRQAALLRQRSAIVAAEAELERKRAAQERMAEAKKKAEAADAAKAKRLGYDPDTTSPKSIARQMMKNTYGWGADEFRCYNNIIMRESVWIVTADNPTSSAYGIPQALPGSKMASAGADWRTNPATQIEWGLGYVKDRYGTPCAAWSFKRAHDWY